MRPTIALSANSSSLLLLIFFVALAVRVAFVGQWAGLPYGSVPILDALSYDNWAQAIADGHWQRGRAFYQSPLFPYLLGGLYWLMGHDLLIGGLFNALLGSVAAALIALCAFKLFGRAEALLAGLLAAFYQPMIFYTAPVMKESLGLFLLAAFLVFALRALDKNHLRDFGWCGFFLGLSVLVRGNVLFLLPALWSLAWMRRSKEAIKGCVLSLAICIVCIAPATLHNFIASNDFVPVNYADGFNLYVGNSPIANGTDAYPADISTNPIQEEVETTYIARQKTGADLKPSGVSLFWRDKALDFVTTHPLAELGVIKKKIIAFWSNDEVFDDYNVDFIRDHFSTALSYSMRWFGLISCLAAFTVVAGWREKKQSILVLSVFALVYMVSLLPFYVTDRYRLSAVVFLLPLAGAAIPCAIRLLKSRAWPQLAGGLIAASCFAFLAAQPVEKGALSPPAFNWGLLTTLYADAGSDAAAIDALHKALALNPQDAGFVPIDRGAEAEQHLGNQIEAERLYNLATQLFPQASGAWYYLGVMKGDKGDLPGARNALNKAVQIDPSFVINYTTLANVYLRMGDRPHAIETLNRAATIDPTDASVTQALRELGQP